MGRCERFAGRQGLGGRTFPIVPMKALKQGQRANAGREGTSVLTVVAQEAAEKQQEPVSLLDQLVRDGARQMLAAALQAEVAAYIEQFADVRDEDGHRLVVRNGYHAERAVVTGAGAVTVQAPRVNDKRVDQETGDRQRFSSRILPAWARKSPKVADLLRDCRRRGMRAPVLAVGDGALGFWAALREVFPQTRQQRCWFHKMANVLAALPKSAHPAATRAMQEIFNAEDGDHARVAAKAFAVEYGGKFPKAVAKITDDLEVLLEFYNYPAEHWIHLRTTNPIESTFATVRHRSKVTRGPGSRAAGLAMAFKLIEAAQSRWRSVNAPHLVALVRAGATFHRGKLVERPEGTEEVMVA